MRPFVAGAIAIGAIAAGGCALVGGFDFDGVTAAPSMMHAGDAEALDGAEPNDSEAAADHAIVDATVVDATEATEASDANAPDDADGGPAAVVDACVGDEEACGPCGRSCQGGVCDGARCLPVVVATVSSPGALAVNTSSVYWTDGADVMIAPLDGGAVSTFYAGSSSLYGSIVLDSTNVYWSSSTFVQTEFLSGGGGFYFDSFSVPVETLTEIAVDPTHLYAVRNDFTVQGGGCASVQIDIAPLGGGGTVTSFASGVCHVVRIVSDGARVYWTDTGTNNSFAHPAVLSRDLDAGVSVPVAPAQSPAGVAVFGSVLYWADTKAGAVYAWPTDGSGTPAVFAASPAPRDLAVDVDGLYWIDGQTAILHASLDGGAVETLAIGQTGATSIHTNGASVFWMNGSVPSDGGPSGAVMKLAK